MSEAGATKLADVQLPVDSYRDAAPHLRRPFTAEAVKWKVQTGTLVVPYIDARLAIERLNLVCPHLWQEGVPGHPEVPAYEPLAAGKGLLCRLTVDGITRFDVGSGYEGKGLYSDAFKRAGVKFGVGVSLYALPKVFLDKNKGQLKDRKSGSKTITEITDSGREGLDKGYRRWLETTGKDLFGAVLDHGDVADSFGDVEAEAAASTDDTQALDSQPEKLTDAKAKALIAEAEKAYADLPKEAKGAKGLPPAAFRRSLDSASHSYDELEKLIADLERRKGEGNA